MSENVMAAAQERVAWINITGDGSAALGDQALQELKGLAATLRADPENLRARYLFGCLLWFNAEARGDDAVRAQWGRVVDVLTPCFIAGLPDLPARIQPDLADAAVPTARRMLVRVFASTEAELLMNTVDLWRRIVVSLPEGWPGRARCLSDLGGALLASFDRLNDDRDLEEAVRVGRESVAATSAGDPDQADLLGNLSNSLTTRFERFGSAADLDEAITLNRAALRARTERDHGRVNSQCGLANALLRRHGLTAERGDLDEAISLLQDAVEDTAAEDPSWITIASNLGVALRGRYEITAALEDLNRAVDTAREAVRLTPPGHPMLLMTLAGLSAALQERFHRTGDMADLHSAISIGRVTAETVDRRHVQRATYLSDLAMALKERFRQAGSQQDLDESVTLLEEAVAVTPDGEFNWAGRRSNLAGSLRLRYETEGALADLDRAITLLDEAVQASPATSAYLSNLAAALTARARHTNALEDLDRAIQAAREALLSAPVEHADRAVLESALAAALIRRSQRTGSDADLDEALESARRSLHATPADHPGHAGRLADISTALGELFVTGGDPMVLAEAIRLGRKAVASTPAGHTDRAGRLSGLGVLLRWQSTASSSSALLDEAIGLGRQAVDSTPDHHPELALHLSNLAATLTERFARAGSSKDLNEAVDIVRTAIAATPVNHHERLPMQMNLSNALGERYLRAGAVEDLEEGLAAARQAAEATPADDGDLASRLSNLGVALTNRFKRMGRRADLDEAVSAFRGALRTTSRSGDHALGLANLGSVLLAGYKATGEEEYLTEALEVTRRAVEATAEGDPARPRRQSNLTAVLADMNDLENAAGHLDEAVEAGREAVRGAVAGQPEHALYLHNLAQALRTRGIRNADAADLDLAASTFVQAAQTLAAAPAVRIQAARNAARLLGTDRVEQAADLLAAAVDLLAETVPRQLRQGDQQHAIARFAGLAGEAAAFALADGRGSDEERTLRALQLLEQGRAVLMSQSLSTRDDLTALRRKRADLATRFVELRDLLDRSSDVSRFESPTTATSERLTDTERQRQGAVDRTLIAQELAEVVSEIREVKDFELFGLPPTVEMLRQEASYGPVIAFNVTPQRSDALLLTSRGARSCELPQLTMEALTEQVNSFYRALHDSRTSPDGLRRVQAQADLVGVLAWLWDTAVGPVFDALAAQGVPVGATSRTVFGAGTDDEPPRIWWMPGGLLGLLPLHAAGRHTESPGGPAPRSAMDLVVSSYTPTVRALRYSRQHVRQNDEEAVRKEADALIVAMPTTPGVPGGGRLPFVDAEVFAVRDSLPSAVLLRQPDPDGGSQDDTAAAVPTKDAVLSRLPSSFLVHFACHGSVHPTDPSQSRLLLHDHESSPLTVSSLSTLRLRKAQLAFLSACDTAGARTAELIDEAIHLASALQLCGFPRVIGTMWYVDDGMAVRIAEAFYSQLDKGGTDAGRRVDTSQSAYALHRVLRSIRDELPRTPSLWAGYLHAGV
ncbi:MULTISPECIES: CHAT domain-containing protein [Streptomyces]|uniref:CHAT domain-containing protein n=1 Tax=Streptomyces TaxID=1883 RepID=UPI00371FBEC8